MKCYRVIELIATIFLLVLDAGDHGCSRAWLHEVNWFRNHTRKQHFDDRDYRSSAVFLVAATGFCSQLLSRNFAMIRPDQHPCPCRRACQ